MKKLSYLAILLISASSLLPAAAAENGVLASAGLALPPVQAPLPKTPRSSQWLTLRKIHVNQAAPDMNGTLVGLVQHGTNIDTVVSELTQGGFRVQAAQDNNGGYLVMADVTGLNAADCAVGLARYYYITDVLVGQQVYNQLFGTPSRSARRPVRIGTVQGGMNGGPVDITINKLEWTITGGMNGSPVQVAINNDAKTITGGANHSPVQLNFEWSPERVLVQGGANHSPVKYLVDWRAGELDGYMDNSPVKLSFNMDEGNAAAKTVRVTGYVNHAPVDLTYDKISGRITGGMDGAPVDVTLVNCDLYDFLQYFFLFAPSVS